jgi:hypothetical protein
MYSWSIKFLILSLGCMNLLLNKNDHSMMYSWSIKFLILSLGFVKIRVDMIFIFFNAIAGHYNIEGWKYIGYNVRKHLEILKDVV